MFRTKCSHDWNKLVETVLPSGYEQMAQAGESSREIKGVGSVLFMKKLVVVLCCRKCGKVKSIVEINPD